MTGTISAAAMAAAAAVACALATPAMALSAGSVATVTTPTEPAIALAGESGFAAPSPIVQASPILKLNPPPPAPFAVSPPAPAAPAVLSLSALVDARSDLRAMDADRECVATAVYFEARGEPLEGQLAVAEVVLNRAASGKYPSSVCAVVKQAAQFSFVRRGKVPPIAKATAAWRRAVAIAHIALDRLVKQIGADVLWYHATYVSPGWGRRLKRVTQIGRHIFYN
jgi:hypothetical protein